MDDHRRQECRTSNAQGQNAGGNPACLVHRGLLFVLGIMAIATVPMHSTAQTPRQGKSDAASNPPVWYTTPPSMTDTLIARGKGRSRNQQVAIDKALAEARSALAGSIELQWENLLREIRKEGGAVRSGKREPVILEGSTVILQKVTRRRGTWTAFVLAGLPAAAARVVLLERLHRDAAWYDAVRGTATVRAFEAPSP